MGVCQKSGQARSVSRGNFQLVSGLHVAKCDELAAIFGVMSFGVHRLLILALALLVAIGPVGGAMAGPHTCTPDTGQPIVAGGVSQGDHAHHQNSDPAGVESPSTPGCANCDKDCCQVSQCSMGHCAGTVAAFQTSTALEFERFAVSAIVLSFDRPLAGRLTPPFRPPQA